MKQETLVPTSQEYDKTRNDSIAANVRRRLPIGAEVLGDGEIHFASGRAEPEK
jgi:hypothetical protein